MQALENLLFLAYLSSFLVFDGSFRGAFARPTPTTTPLNLVLDARDPPDTVQDVLTTSLMTGYALEKYGTAMAIGTAPGNEATTFVYMGHGARVTVAQSSAGFVEYYGTWRNDCVFTQVINGAASLVNCQHIGNNGTLKTTFSKVPFMVTTATEFVHVAVSQMDGSGASTSQTSSSNSTSISHGTSKNLIIGVVVAVVSIALIVTLIVIILMYKRRQRLQGNNVGTQDVVHSFNHDEGLIQRPTATSVHFPPSYACTDNTDSEYSPVTTAMSTAAIMGDRTQSSRSYYSSSEKQHQYSSSQLFAPNVPYATTRNEESGDQLEMIDAISRLERRIDTMQAQMLPPGYS